MSELEIVRGAGYLLANDWSLGRLHLMVHEESDEPTGNSHIVLPRIEVLQLRDWLTQWLSETPP